MFIMAVSCKKFFIAVLCAAVAVFSCPAFSALEDSVDGLFNSNLSEESRESLAAGNIVVNALSSEKKLCIRAENAGIQRVLDRIAEFKPNYIAEVIKIYPYEGKEDFVSRFNALITNMPAESKIPCRTKKGRKEKEEILTLTYETLSANTEEAYKSALAKFSLTPFDLADVDVGWEETDDFYYYTLTNLDKIKYKDVITCVNKKNMRLALTIFRCGDKWVLYGFVAADAPGIFFIRKKVEAALVERVGAFCMYFFNDL